jgi:uncharacterized protein (TIGR02217 family)
MSTSVFPSLPGASYPSPRSPVFDTTVQQAISGKETRIALQSTPRWKWDLSFSILRSGGGFSEFQQVVGFFNQRRGMFDTFLYEDSDDNAVVGQQIGIGDGVTTSFQLVRQFGGFVEPMLAPNTGATINIYLNAIKQTSGYSVSGWGTSNPGVLTFTSAPGSGVVITADFNYYWPVRFATDSADFNLFLKEFWELKKLSIISVKN